MTQEINHSLMIPEDHAGLRLDRSLAILLPEYSRAKLQSWISQQLVTVDGEFLASRYQLRGGESIVISAISEPLHSVAQPEHITLDIVFEDEHLIVINKAAGLVVHPGAGNPSGTLLNALLYHEPQQANLPRAGIVHRLDKDTTGLMVVAKSLLAHTALVDLLQDHQIDRRYHAIVRGQLISGGTIDEPIGRHPTDRIKMAVNSRGKAARTHYTIIEKFQRHTWVEARLETGRTHQIRVHFAHKRMPLVGDAVYAPRVQRVANVMPQLNDALCGFTRQALHSHYLAFAHPASGESLDWQVPMPADMNTLVSTLREYSQL